MVLRMLMVAAGGDDEDDDRYDDETESHGNDGDGGDACGNHIVLVMTRTKLHSPTW